MINLQTGRVGSCGVCLALTTVILLVPAASAAGEIDSSDLGFFELRAENASARGAIVVEDSQGVWDYTDGSYTWTQLEPVAIVDDDSGEVIATLLSAELAMTFDRDFEMTYSFGVRAGAELTSFVFDSPLLDYANVPAALAEARASASFTVTDTGSGADSRAEFRALGPAGTGAFQTFVNGDATTGHRFAHLVSSASVTGGGSVTAAQSDPLWGTRSVGRAVDALGVQVAFSLTPDDTVYSMTSFEVPAAPEACRGDADLDGRIGLTDLDRLLTAFAACRLDEGYDADADFDRDGCVGLSDLTELLAHYGDDCLE